MELGIEATENTAPVFLKFFFVDARIYVHDFHGKRSSVDAWSFLRTFLVFPSLVSTIKCQRPHFFVSHYVIFQFLKWEGEPK